MKKTLKPIVFFGSGPVAAQSLELLAVNFAIEAVVTKPRPPHHKGDVPVLDVVDKLNLPLRTAPSKAELDKIFAEKPFTSEVGVLIDFGIIVSQKVIDYFPLGIVNSHFSLLPEWRGADPITFSILSGQKQTGVSLMLLVEAMDEGPVLACGKQDLDDAITTPILTQKLITLSDTLLKEELPRYLKGEIQGTPQEKLTQMIPDYPASPSYSRKLTKEDGLLDWNKPAEVLEREIRAYTEWPKSRTTLGAKDIIVTKAHVTPSNGDLQPGDIIASLIPQGMLAIQTAKDVLCIDMLKPAGKQEMTSKSFIAGHKNLLLN